MSRPASRSQLYALAVGLLVVTCTLGWYAVHRQQIADRRYDRQRQAICKVLASLPGQNPLPNIDHLRQVEARPHHPQDCEPMPRPKATPTPSPGRADGATVIVVPSRGGASPRPRTPRPSPRPTDTPRPHPSPPSSPTPTPSPTCDLQDVLHHPGHCLL